MKTKFQILWMLAVLILVGIAIAIYLIVSDRTALSQNIIFQQIATVIGIKTAPIETPRLYHYRNAHEFPSLSKPISRYVNKRAPSQTCVPGTADCVPVFNFYALVNPYAETPVTKERNWFFEKNSQSVSYWGSPIARYPKCGLTNAPMTSDSTIAPEHQTSYPKTGVEFINGRSHRFAPTFTPGGDCPTEQIGGPSFTTITRHNRDGGIGIFTLNGPGFHNEIYTGFKPHDIL